MKRRYYSALILLSLTCPLIWGQRPAAKAPPNRLVVREFLDTIHFSEQYEAGQKLTAASWRQAAYDKLRRRVIDPDRAQLRRLYDSVDQILAQNSTADVYRESAVAAFQKHFTERELAELTRFFSSAVGQKYLRSQQPDSGLMFDLQEARATAERQQSDAMTRKIEARIEEIAAESFKK